MPAPGYAVEVPVLPRCIVSTFPLFSSCASFFSTPSSPTHRLTPLLPVPLQAAGLATMIAAMRPDIDNVDEYVRNTTARAFSVVASALGIPALLPFLKAVCQSKKSWQARHTGVKIVQQVRERGREGVGGGRIIGVKRGGDGGARVGSIVGVMAPPSLRESVSATTVVRHGTVWQGRSTM